MPVASGRTITCPGPPSGDSTSSPDTSPGPSPPSHRPPPSPRGRLDPLHGHLLRAVPDDPSHAPTSPSRAPPSIIPLLAAPRRAQRGTSATARTGEPDPPLIFSGRTTNRQNGGRVPRFFRFSTM